MDMTATPFQEAPDDLAQYLQRQVVNGITYLTIALQPTMVESTFNFVIHPSNQDGETADFVVSADRPASIRLQNLSPTKEDRDKILDSDRSLT